MSEEPLDERQVAFNTCACPRSEGEILSAPKCEADNYLSSFSPKGKPLLFVKHPYMGCNKLSSYGGSYLCACTNRIKFYSTYKL